MMTANNTRSSSLLKASILGTLAIIRSPEQSHQHINIDGGYVHLNLLKIAIFVINRMLEILRRLFRDGDRDYNMLFVEHSLDSGVAVLMIIIVIKHMNQFRGIGRSHIRCYAIASARRILMNMAVKYTVVINYVILHVCSRPFDFFLLN